MEVLSIAGKVGFHQLDKRGRGKGWWQISSSRGKTCSKAQSPEPAWKSHDTHESSLPGAGPQEGSRALGDEQGRLEAGQGGLDPVGHVSQYFQAIPILNFNILLGPLKCNSLTHLSAD